jgi:drug/metabolite transporter (DMT)-like permease
MTGATGPAPAGAAPAVLAWMPALFVLIWSTGFVVARFGMPHAPPMGFLAWRFGLSVGVFALWVAATRAAWPRDRAQCAHLAVVGLLVHAGYLGGVWSAVKLGLGAGTCALVAGLQPVLTALWVASVGRPRQRIAPRQWLGLALGLVGLLLVVDDKLGVGEVTPRNLALAVAALLSITAGTLYQKRFVAPCDVRSANLVQLAAAFVATLPFAWLETEAVRWVAPLAGAMAWSVLVLTLGGSSLLYLLMQRGAATHVASLMYLVPPCTAVLAWMAFGERLTATVLAGLAGTAIGVALVVREPMRAGARGAIARP